ncbi:DUF1488 domain-containing protein [Erwinia sp. P6884]|uniref:DUF1488 domain-containing protein n=1 Tax=Erwinia sp. P6884 TaxID=3141450 RepID=UPI003192B73E
MNQAIQFPDREWWDEKINAICFPALVNGFQITCAIRGEAIVRRFGEHQEPLTHFRLNRWDIEDEAEQAIKEEREDTQGWLWLS